MESDCSRRFDLELIGESGLIYPMLEDTMGSRRAADITHTKEENAVHTID